MYKSRHGLNPNHLIHCGKSHVITSSIAPLEWLVAMHIISDRNTGGKTSNIKWLFESILSCYSYFKSFTVLGSYTLHPRTPTAKTTQSYKISGHFILSQMLFLTLKTGHWKKRKLNSSPRYGPALRRNIVRFILTFWLKIDQLT